MRAHPSCGVCHSSVVSWLVGGLCAVLLLAGCAGESLRDAQRNTTGSPTEDYPINVAQREEVLTVPVAADGTLTAEDQVRVTGFLEQWRRRTSGAGGTSGTLHFSVQGVRPAIAALAVARIRGLASARGISLVADATPTEAMPVPGITLRGSRRVAVSPDCPSESAATNDFHNRTSPAFGCSLQRSLAAMIDSPDDLLAPRKAAAADGPRLARVIDQYRQGQATAANTESTGNAAIATSVGKTR